MWALYKVRSGEKHVELTLRRFQAQNTSSLRFDAPLNALSIHDHRSTTIDSRSKHVELTLRRSPKTGFRFTTIDQRPSTIDQTRRAYASTLAQDGLSIHDHRS